MGLTQISELLIGHFMKKKKKKKKKKNVITAPCRTLKTLLNKFIGFQFSDE